MKIKEHHIHRVVYQDEYCGIPFWIVENGVYTDDGESDYRWYCAYVRVPKKMKKLDPNELDVHGGITFTGRLGLIGYKEVWGWDYNHHYDVDFENGLKTKFQSKPLNEVIDFISTDCQEFIRRYLI